MWSEQQIPFLLKAVRGLKERKVKDDKEIRRGKQLQEKQDTDFSSRKILKDKQNRRETPGRFLQFKK